MDLRTGLNPYGLTYHLGLQGRGTPRVNPNAVGLDGFLALTEELGGRAIELWDGWLAALDDAGLVALRGGGDRCSWCRRCGVMRSPGRA